MTFDELMMIGDFRIYFDCILFSLNLLKF